MLKHKEQTKQKMLKGALFLGIAVIIAAGLLFFKAQKGAGAKDYRDSLKALTQGKPEAVVTIGILRDGRAEYHVYGEDGKELPYETHTYAVGSITKTFTGALAAKQVAAGKLELEEDISKYLPGAKPGVTLRRLLTHTSGLSDEWEQALSEDASAAFNREEMTALLNAQQLPGEDCVPEYSNFGAALVGTVAAASENKTYEAAMNDFIQNDLGLANTRVGGTGDLKNYWTWNASDEMMGAGAILSNAEDMLQYGSLYLKEEPAYLKNCLEPLAEFTEDYDCGYFWLIDEENGICWHNGELAMEDENGRDVGFQSFLGISKETGSAVVVLSNLIAYDEDDTAYTDIIGYQLLCQ